MMTITQSLLGILLLSFIGSAAAEAPEAYEPIEIRDSEFDSVTEDSGEDSTWVYNGSAPLKTVLARPEAESEWWDGTVIRLLPGDSVMHEIPGEFVAGDRLFVGINAMQEGSGSSDEALRVNVRASDGWSTNPARPIATGPNWRRGFANFKFPVKWSRPGPCFVRFSNHGSASILLDKASVARIVRDEDGFGTIFNGKDLEGWTGNTEGYGVEDGAIRTYPKRAGGNLYTDGQFDDFVFRFAFKVPPGANNGIAVRAPLGGDAAYKGMEFQVLENSHPKYAGLKDWQFHGSIYGLAPALRGYQAPPGEWNHEEIRVVGRKARVVLNGKIIMEVDLDEVQKDGTLSGRDHPGAARAAGHLGFCGHGDVVHFKDLRVRPVSGTKTPSGR